MIRALFHQILTNFEITLTWRRVLSTRALQPKALIGSYVKMKTAVFFFNDKPPSEVCSYARTFHIFFS